jgi:RimJ/RimL family protein N-acetyltransferase
MDLQLKSCRLRSWRLGDEPSLVHHANNYKIWRNVRDQFPHPYTWQDAEWWVGHAGHERPVSNFAIDVEGEAVGGIGLVAKEDIYRCSAEIGYWLSEEHWGRGVMTEAVRAATTYGFKQFKVQRIYAGVLEWNPASMRVLEKAGFRFEARLRNAIVKEGHVMDEMIYAALRDEWSIETRGTKG